SGRRVFSSRAHRAANGSRPRFAKQARALGEEIQIFSDGESRGAGSSRCGRGAKGTSRPRESECHDLRRFALLKTAALALVVLVSGSFATSSALAGGGVRHPPVKIGKINKQGGKLRVFRPSRVGKIIVFSRISRPKTTGPDRLPGL